MQGFALWEAATSDTSGEGGAVGAIGVVGTSENLVLLPLAVVKGMAGEPYIIVTNQEQARIRLF